MYEPSSNLRHVSRNSLSEPHMFASLMLICCAKSFVLYVCVFRIACAFGSRGCTRDTKPSFICSAPASTAIAVHLASLFALFLSSLATTAPRCVSILSLQSIPVTLESNSFKAFTSVVSALPLSMPLDSLTAFNSHRHTSLVVSSTFHLRYLYAIESLSSSPKKGTGSPNLYASFSTVSDCSTKARFALVPSAESC